MTERAPFKSSVTNFEELRKRREELFPPMGGDANGVNVEPQPAVTSESGYAGYYDDPGPVINPKFGPITKIINPYHRRWQP